MQQIKKTSIQQKITRAEENFLNHKVLQAIGGFSRAVLLDSEDSQIYLKLAKSYEFSRDLSTALMLYKRSFKLKNQQLVQNKIKELSLARGYSLLEVSLPKNILSQFQNQEFKKSYQSWAYKLFSTTKSKTIRNALAFIQSGNKGFALEQLSQESREGKDPEGQILRGKVLWSLQKVLQGNNVIWEVKKRGVKDDQIVKFMQMIQPKIQQIISQTRLFLIENDIEKCLLYIKRGLDIYPNNNDLLVMRSFISRRRGQFSKALADLQTALYELNQFSKQTEIKKQIAITHNQRAVTLFKAKSFKEALNLFQLSLQYDPQDWGVIVNIGDCYKMLGSSDSALQFYKQAKAKIGDKAQINNRIGYTHASRAVLYFNKNLLKQAKQEALQAIKNVKNNGQFYTLCGRILMQMQQVQQGQRMLVRGNELQSENKEVVSQIKKSKKGDQFRKA